ncbi:MAG: hypothetical protein AAF458_13570 [Pseudomonadota bacterium]
MVSSTVFAAIAGYIGRPDAPGSVGIFRRDGATGQWQHVLDDRETFCVYVHPEDPVRVFAGTPDGVWRSTDGGRRFGRASFPDENVQIWSFLSSSTNADLMYAGASPIGVYRSEDGGEHWEALPTPNVPERCTGPFNSRVMRLVQVPGNPEELYAALEIAGAMRTVDAGERWEDLGSDLVRLSAQPHLRSAIVQRDTEAEGMLDGHAMAICAAAPDAVVLACRMGLFATRDGGQTWDDMRVGRYSPTTYARDVRTSPHDAQTMYAALSVAAASQDGGVYRSTDAGSSWARFDDVQVHGTIMSIAPSARCPGEFFFGARYNGELFGTSDDGESWSDISIPTAVKDLYSVACA